MSNVQLKTYIEERCLPEPNSGCWLWLLSTGSHGYAQGAMQSVTGQPVSLAHRLSHLAFKGAIAKGMEVDHRCRNRLCVNPDHLEAVSKMVNRRRQFGLRSEDPDRCARGHDGYGRNAAGKMHCPTCARMAQEGSIRVQISTAPTVF